MYVLYVLCRREIVRLGVNGNSADRGFPKPRIDPYLCFLGLVSSQAIDKFFSFNLKVVGDGDTINISEARQSVATGGGCAQTTDHRKSIVPLARNAEYERAVKSPLPGEAALFAAAAV